MRRLALAGLCLVTGACSSIVEGTSQKLTFNSVPDGADCRIERDGKVLGTVRTPGSIRVDKTKHDIEAICVKDGYREATAHLNSDAAAATFGNILMGGGIGWAIDSASGADNKYNDVTTVTLVPLGSPADAEPTPETSTTPDGGPASRPGDATIPTS